MKILSLVTGPVYRGEIHGGSYRILLAVLDALSDHGHEVTLLCGKGPRHEEPYIRNRTLIKPILPLRTFPFPFGINAEQITKVFDIIKMHVEDADVIYNHDGQFLWLLGLYIKKPHQRLIASFRDFVYAETLQCLANLKLADIVIANSAYSFRVLSALSDKYNLAFVNSLICIENGVDLAFWSSPISNSSSVLCETGLSEEVHDKRILLCPVRPAINKGILESLAVLKRLVNRGHDFHLVFTRYVDAAVPTGSILEKKYVEWKYDNPMLINRVHQIAWQDSEHLRALYRVASVTLCLGTYPEAFGSNVYVESVASGTPCVASLAGAMRTTFPVDTSFLVAPWSIDNAVEHIENIFDFSHLTLSRWQNKTREFLANKHSFTLMQNRYLTALTDGNPGTVSMHNFVAEAESHDNRRVPWQVVLDDGRIFDDFKESFV